MLSVVPFTSGNLAIFRIGDGSATLNSTATAAFIDEYQPDGTLVQSIPFDTTGSSALTVRGDSFTQGGLGRSENGQYLVVGGFRKDVGLANPVSDTVAVTNRVVGRVDASGNIDTTTALTDAFDNLEIRSTSSFDGSSFYISGSPGSVSNSTGGLRYVPSLGSTTSNSLSQANNDNLRQVQVIDGKLYITAGALAPGKTVWQVGTGLPTSGAQTYTPTIPLNPPVTSQYNTFMLADFSASVPGFDTIYAISSLQNQSGLEKWSLVGGTWVLNNTVSFPSNPTDSAFGLTGSVQGNTVTMFVTSTSAGSGPSQLQSIVDTSGYNANITGFFNYLADAPFNTVFKGLMLVPSAAPVVTPGGGSASYSENDPSVAVAPGLTLSDADSTLMNSAKVSITGNFAGAEDQLTFTPVGGITGSYSSVDGVLTLSGTATVADYQTVLQSVKYRNTSDNPSTLARTITFQVRDNSEVKSTLSTRGVTVAAVNDAPAITMPAPQLVGLSHALTFSSINGNAMTLADVDAQSGNLQLNLSVTAGTLTLSTLAGLTGSGDGTASLSYTGTLAALSAAINGMVYDSPPSAQAVTLSATLNDQGNTGSGGAQSDTENLLITVSAVPNQPPVVTTTGSALNYTENAGAVAVDSLLTVTDADHSNLTGATVSIVANYASSQDVLSFVNQNGITGTFDSFTGVLTLVGISSKANYQTALRSVTYTNTSDNPNTAPRTVQFVASDGVDPSAPANRTVNVSAVNDAPVNVAPGLQSFAKNTNRVFSAANGNGLSFSDVDINAGNAQITLASTGGTLALSTLAGLTGSGNGTGNLTYSGTIAALNTALNGLTFTPTLNFTGNTSISFTSSDLGNTGSGGIKMALSTIPITVVNPAGLVINELLFRPPVSTSTNQYVELRSTAGGGFVIPNGTYLVGVEGYSNLNTGAIHDIFDLGGMTTGPNGQLVILPSNNLYTTPTNVTDPNATVLEQGPISPGFGNNAFGLPSTVGHSGSNGFFSIENANPISFFLVQAPTAPLVNDDIDSNDDGLADGTQYLNWTILDSVGFGNSLSGTPNRLYAAINFIDDTGSTTALTGTTVLTGFSPGYLGRTGDTTGSSPSDWLAATLQGSSPSWTLSKTLTSAPGFAGLPLDHIGGSNFSGVLAKPVVDLNGALGGRDGLASFVQGSGATSIAGSSLVTDVDSANLSSLTVTITNLLNGANETLAVNTAGTGISASYSAGVLTLSGSDTLAHYQQVLQSLTYNNVAVTPNLTTRVLDVSASDGTNTSLNSQLQLGLFSNLYSARINEIDINPPGADNPYEYIELRGTPGSALTSMYLVSFESQYIFGNPGDPGVGQTGLANFVVNLTGQVFGSNGMLIIKSPTAGFTPPVGTTVVTSADFDVIGGILKSGSNSFFLVRSPSSPIVVDTDYDTDDNGSLELPNGSEVVDSVSWKHRNFDNDLPYGVVRLPQSLTSPDAVTRFPSNTIPQIAAWYYGGLDQTGTNPAQLNYDPATSSANLPSGGLLTPGGPNFPVNSTVVGRHLFYNQSGTSAPLRYDGNNAAINANDDLAIATNKSAYLPGSGPATFANVSSYTKGINGIMIDIAGAHGTITASDFIFRVGNNNTPNSWVAGPAPSSISVRAGAGVSGSDRVTLTWANGTITKKWLEVVVLANANTGLAQKAGYPVRQGDVFFFGSAPGDTGAGNTATQANVSVTDELGARNNPASLFSNVPITNLYDFNRDAQVNSTDALVARNNPTSIGNVTRFITVANPPTAPEASPASDEGGVASALAMPSGDAKASDAIVFGKAVNRQTEVDSRNGLAADLLHHLVASTPKSRKALTAIDKVVERMGLEGATLDDLLADLGLA